ncbi:MAG: hypothetical protein Q6363_002230 [Candidatus Njordarchaeota archaeon]
MYTIIVFYRYKELSEEEEEKVSSQWKNLKKEFDRFGVRIVSNNSHAFGTSWNGFLIIEAEDFDDYVKFWKWFKDKIRWYIESTQTIVGSKRE